MLQVCIHHADGTGVGETESVHHRGGEPLLVAADDQAQRVVPRKLGNQLLRTIAAVIVDDEYLVVDSLKGAPDALHQCVMFSRSRKAGMTVKGQCSRAV